MAILERVKQRIETDLDDTELGLLIDEANQEIINRFGSHANPASPVTEVLEGQRRKIVVNRPINTAYPITVTEYYDYIGFVVGGSTYVLATNDFRVWPPSTLERRQDGVSGTPGDLWGDRVEVEYVPVNDGDQREEVIIKLVMLAIEYEGVSSRNVGDVTGSHYEYAEERNKLLSTLVSRNGLLLA